MGTLRSNIKSMKENVEGNKMIKYVNGKTRKQVKEEYPDHVKIVKVEGGYAVFETWDDYETWRNQK